MKKMKAEIINPEIEKDKTAVLVSFFIKNFKKKTLCDEALKNKLRITR